MKCNRREFLSAAGAVLVVSNEMATGERFKPTAETTRPASKPALRPDLGDLVAANFHTGGRSCAEAMLCSGLAYLGEPKELVRMATPFGGGMHMGDHCGFYCGGLMTIGLACAGRPDGKTRAGELSKAFTQTWKKRRPLLCREIKKAQKAGTLKASCKEIGRDAGKNLDELLGPIADAPERARFSRRREAPTTRSSDQAEKRNVVMTVVYDNNPGPKGLTPAWGFACMVQGFDQTLLFDTGGSGEILLDNMRRLSLDPRQIDVVVLSHIHGDHTGGLWSFLNLRKDVTVYVPAGFPGAFNERVRSLGAGLQEAPESAVICPGVRTTGTLGKGAIEEQGLCIKTAEGWVLVTGCAHPGVANMATAAKQVTGGPLSLVVGGFHMGAHSKRAISAVIDRFQALGVQRAAPCHCSGDSARQLFKQRYGDRCTLAGVGSLFQFQPDR